MYTAFVSYCIFLQLFTNELRNDEITLIIKPNINDTVYNMGVYRRDEIVGILGKGYKYDKNTRISVGGWCGEENVLLITVGVKGIYDYGKRVSVTRKSKMSWLYGVEMVIEDVVGGEKWRYENIPAKMTNHQRCYGDNEVSINTPVGWVDLEELVGGMKEKHVYKVSLIVNDKYIDGIEPNTIRIEPQTIYVVAHRAISKEEVAMRHCRRAMWALELAGNDKCNTRKDLDIIEYHEKYLIRALEEYPGLECAIDELAAIYMENKRYYHAYGLLSNYYSEIRKKEYNINKTILKMTICWLYGDIGIAEMYCAPMEWKEYEKSVRRREAQ